MMLVLSLLLLVLASSAEAGPTTRIVNGKEAEPHSWPAQLSLRLDNRHNCGAVVINENFALTAAHCVDYPGFNVSRFSVVCGAHDLQDKSVGQVSVAAEIKMHEDYDPNATGYPNDIAVIKLATPLQLNDACKPANLPPDDSKTYSDKVSHITGWGRLAGGALGATRLKQAQLNTISNSECRTRFFSSPGIRDTNICVFDRDNVYGACNGDSGGPVFTPDHDTNLVTVTGLASFVWRGCNTNYPSVYTRVSTYIGWINSAMASM